MTGAAGCLATGNYGFLAIKCGIDIISMTVSHVIVCCQPCFPLLFFFSSLVADERFLPGEAFSRDAKRQKACHICANLMRVISMRVLEHLRRHRISVACITGMQSTAFAFSSWFLAAAEQTPQSGTAKQNILFCGVCSAAAKNRTANRKPKFHNCKVISTINNNNPKIKHGCHI